MTTQKFNVLYIEDNIINIRLMEEIFEVMGDHLKLAVAENGLQGLEMVQSVKPELILVDIQLPDINGYQVLTELRNFAEFATTPVFALTASAMTENAEKVSEAGFNEFIVKPLDVPQFITLVNSYLQV